MIKINEKIINLDRKDTFHNVSSEVNKYIKNNPTKKVLSLGVGDVSKPIIKPIIDAMKSAVDELSKSETFKGYGNSHGYNFLKEKIIEVEYKDFNFSVDEVYISAGSKMDVTNILELFDISSSICITSPTYPIYKDGASCLNREVQLLKSDDKNNFIPEIPNKKFDIIYICSPNNPTGIAYSNEELKKWVDYAKKNGSVILYDNVYSSYIRSKGIPKSIYEVEGAFDVAIEFRSFSKDASFTGVRCSYYIIPNGVYKGINEIWKRRNINRFNGADYIAQRGAEESLSNESQKLLVENVDYYLENARLLRESFLKCSFKVWGGIDAPYLWIKTKNMTSWETFYFFLEELNIVIIPGIVFGEEGDNYFRVSSFGNRETIKTAIERIEKYCEKSI